MSCSWEVWSNPEKFISESPDMLSGLGVLAGRPAVGSAVFQSIGSATAAGRSALWRLGCSGGGGGGEYSRPNCY